MCRLFLCFFLPLLICTACGSDSTQSTLADARNDLTGTWTGILTGNRNQAYAITLTLSGNNSALNGTIVVANNLLPPHRADRWGGEDRIGALQGALEPGISVVRLHTTVRNSPVSVDVAAIVVGDDMLLALDSSIQRMSAGTSHSGVLSRHAEKAGDVENVIKTLATTRSQATTSDCPDSHRQWIAIAKDLTKTQRNPSERLKLLNDNVFVPAFGKRHADMSADDLLAAANTVAGGCNDVRADYQLVRQLSLLLSDVHVYINVRIGGERQRIVRQWATELSEENTTLIGQNGQLVAHLRDIDSAFRLASVPDNGVYTRWRDLIFDSAAARASLDDLLRQIDSSKDNFFMLVAYAKELPRYDQDVADTLRERITQYFSSAASDYAQSLSNTQQAGYLRSWLNAQHAGNAQCPSSRSKDCLTAVSQFEKALDALAERLAEKERARLSNQSLPDGLDAVAQLVTTERQLRTRYRSMTDSRPFEALLEDLADERAGRQARQSRQLLALIEETTGSRQLLSLQNRYFMPGDLRARRLRKLRSVLEERLQDIAPFGSGPGTEYLNALHNNDTAALRQLDREYTAGLRSVLEFSLQGTANIGAILDAAQGKVRGSSARETQRMIANLSAVSAVFGTYLIDYDARYAKCLPRNAPEFTTVRGMDLVTRDGYGVEMTRIRQWTERTQYRVQPEMTEYFRGVWIAGSDNADADLMDGLINDDRIKTLVRATRNVMKDFDCDDPAIARLESGLRNYYDTAMMRPTR